MQTAPVALGIIVPSANSILERDLTRLELDNISFHFSRVMNSEDTPEQLRAMKDQAISAAQLLTHTRWMSALALGCTSGSFIGGPGYDEQTANAISAASGLPAITTSGAVIDALNATGRSRIAVFDPYPAWLSAQLNKFLVGNGFNIVQHCHGFDMQSSEELDDYQSINNWILDEVIDDADIIYIACTNFSWLRGIRPLQAASGRPVLTSNSATVWKLLQLVNSPARPPELGGYLP